MKHLDITHYYVFENYIFENSATSHRGQWVKLTKNTPRPILADERVYQENFDENWTENWWCHNRRARQLNATIFIILWPITFCCNVPVPLPPRTISRIPNKNTLRGRKMGFSWSSPIPSSCNTLWYDMGLLPDTQNCGCACAGNVFPVAACKRSRHASRHVRHARAVMHAGIAN